MGDSSYLNFMQLKDYPQELCTGVSPIGFIKSSCECNGTKWVEVELRDGRIKVVKIEKNGKIHELPRSEVVCECCGVVKDIYEIATPELVDSTNYDCYEFSICCDREIKNKKEIMDLVLEHDEPYWKFYVETKNWEAFKIQVLKYKPSFSSEFNRNREVVKHQKHICPSNLQLTKELYDKVMTCIQHS